MTRILVATVLLPAAMPPVSAMRMHRHPLTVCMMPPFHMHGICTGHIRREAPCACAHDASRIEAEQLQRLTSSRSAAAREERPAGRNRRGCRWIRTRRSSSKSLRPSLPWQEPDRPPERRPRRSRAPCARIPCAAPTDREQ